VRAQWITFLLMGLCSLLLLGCSEDGINRSVMEVVSVNDGAPVVVSQRDPGPDRTINTADDFIPPSSVTLTVANRAYDASLSATESEPFGAYLIESVRIQWQPLGPEAAGGQLLDYDQSYPLNEIVRRGTQVELNIVLVTQEMKSQSFLQDLVNTQDVILANAILTFSGHDTAASDAPYGFGVTIPVQFVGLAAPK